MNPAIIAAVRAAIGDWRDEARVSREQAETHERIAGEFRRDEARAEAKVAELEAAVREEGATA